MGHYPTKLILVLFGFLGMVTLASAAPESVSVGQQAYLKASNTNANDFFGDSVAIDGDVRGRRRQADRQD